MTIHALRIAPIRRGWCYLHVIVAPVLAAYALATGSWVPFGVNVLAWAVWAWQAYGMVNRLQLSRHELIVERGWFWHVNIRWTELCRVEIGPPDAWWDHELVLTCQDGRRVAATFGSFDLDRAEAVVADLEARREAARLRPQPRTSRNAR